MLVYRSPWFTPPTRQDKTVLSPSRRCTMLHRRHGQDNKTLLSYLVGVGGVNWVRMKVLSCLYWLYLYLLPFGVIKNNNNNNNWLKVKITAAQKRDTSVTIYTYLRVVRAKTILAPTSGGNQKSRGEPAIPFLFFPSPFLSSPVLPFLSTPSLRTRPLKCS